MTAQVVGDEDALDRVRRARGEQLAAAGALARVVVERVDALERDAGGKLQTIVRS